MYKILIKFQNKIGKNIWEAYGTSTTSTTGKVTNKEFETEDIDELRDKIKELDMSIGYENIRIIKDVTYEVMVDVNEGIDVNTIQLATSEDIKNIYNTAYNNVFS